jgi:hypothetical protein
VKDEHLQSTLGHFIIKPLLNLLHIQYINQDCHTKSITIVLDLANRVSGYILNHYDGAHQSSINVTTTDSFRNSLKRLDYLAGQFEYGNGTLNCLNKHLNDINNQSNRVEPSYSLLLEKQLDSIVEVIRCCIKIILGQTSNLW